MKARQQGTSTPGAAVEMDQETGTVGGEFKQKGEILMSDTRSTLWIALAACLLATTAACDSAYDSSDEHSKVNGSIHVAAGQAAEAVSTVNGGIHIDDNATVDSAGTVNGGIHLGAHAIAKSLKTVNGGISVENGAHATDVKSVNGDLDVKEGADVSGVLANVNGKISVTAAHVG